MTDTERDETRKAKETLTLGKRTTPLFPDDVAVSLPEVDFEAAVTTPLPGVIAGVAIPIPCWTHTKSRGHLGLEQLPICLPLRRPTDSVTPDIDPAQRLGMATIHALEARGHWEALTEVSHIWVVSSMPTGHLRRTVSEYWRILHSSNPHIKSVFAACSGFSEALYDALQTQASGRKLIVVAEAMQSIVAQDDLKTVQFFADAGVAWLFKDNLRLLGTSSVHIPEMAQPYALSMPVSYSSLPLVDLQNDIVVPAPVSPDGVLRMDDGQRVKAAVLENVPVVMVEAMRNANLTQLPDIIVIHHPNQKLMKDVAEKFANLLNLPVDKIMERFIIELKHTGNTSSATIPLALSLSQMDPEYDLLWDRVKEKQAQDEPITVMAVGFGAGFYARTIVLEVRPEW